MSASGRSSAWLLLAVLVVAACRPAATPSAPTSTDDAATGSADGYVFVATDRASGRSGDGTVHNGIALGRDATAPAGHRALGGAKLALFGTPAGEPPASTPVATAEPRGDGYARFERVPPGLYKLRVTPSAGDVAEFQLTILGDATIRWGRFPVTRDRAFEAARRGAADSIRPEATFIHAPQTPLPASVIVEPALGNDEGELDPSLRYTVDRPQWLFYVNPFTESRFQHPTKFVFVDAESGKVTVRDATSWPSINRRSYYWQADTLRSSADMLLAPPQRASEADRIPTTAATSARYGLMSIHADHVPGCPAPKTYALLIQGSDESSQKHDLATMKKVFGRGGIPPATFFEWAPHPNADPVDEVRKEWAKIKAAATACDHVFVYLTAHGNPNGTAQLDRNATRKDGTPADPALFSLKFLDWSNCKACHITIVIDTCFAGQALNTLKPVFTPLTGRKVFIIAATATNTTSAAFETWQIPETGSAFTNAFVASFTELAASGGAVPLDTAFARATGRLNGSSNAVVQNQSPQYWERKLAPGETCALSLATTPPPTTPPPPPTPTPTANLTVTVTEAPSSPPTTQERTTEPTPVRTPEPTPVRTQAPTPQPTSPPPASTPNLGTHHGTYRITGTLAQELCYSPFETTMTVQGNADGSALTISFKPNRPPTANTRTYRGQMSADGSFSATSSGSIQSDAPSAYTGTLSGKMAGGQITATETLRHSACGSAVQEIFAIRGSK